MRNTARKICRFRIVLLFLFIAAATIASATLPLKAETWGWAMTADIAGVTDVFRLLEASDGALYAGTGPDGGIYKTRDGGATWFHLADLEGATDVLALLEASDGAIYAATIPNGLVYKSIDAGGSWSRTGSLGGEREAKCLAEAPDGAIYAGTGLSGGVYRTTNGGESWERTAELGDSDFVYSLCVGPGGVIYAGTDGRVYRTSNGGTSWAATADMPGAAYIYSLLRASDDSIYAGCAGEVYRTSDGGEIWTSSGRLGARVYAVYTLFEHPDGSVYATTGSEGVIYRTVSRGTAWEHAAVLSGARDIYCLIVTGDETLYAGTSAPTGVGRGGAVYKYAPLLRLTVRSDPSGGQGGIDVRVAVQRVERRFDAYGVIAGPGGIFSFVLGDTGALSPGIRPLARSVNGLGAPLSLQLLSFSRIPEGAESGVYTITAGLVSPGKDPSNAENQVPGCTDRKTVTVGE